MLGGEKVILGEWLEPAVGADENAAAVGADPEATRIIVSHGEDAAVGETLFGTKRVPFPIWRKPGESSPTRANPKAALIVLIERGDHLGFQCGCVPRMEGGGTDTIEAHETFLTTHPEIAVAGLENTGDRTSFQALIGAPVNEGNRRCCVGSHMHEGNDANQRKPAGKE